MTITPDSPLIGPPSGSLARARDYAGTDTREYIAEVWRLAWLVHLDPAIIVAQWAVETADGTSPRWVNNRNPAGLGIEADGDPDPATLTQIQAAHLHVWALWFAMKRSDPVLAVDPPESVFLFMRRWRRKYHDAACPVAKTIADLQRRYVDATGEPQAVWAWDNTYAASIVSRHRAIFGAQEDTPDVSIPETIDYAPLPVPVIIDLIGEEQPNQNPGIPMTPTSGTWHETANPNPGADALMHGRYLDQGAPDEDGRPQQLSYHFAVDDTRIVQKIALNRVAWHGGDSANGLGPSTRSIAVECCVNRDGNLSLAQSNTAALFGLLRARGIIGEVYQHNHWSGKDCPAQLRRGNAFLWRDALILIAARAAKYRAPVPPAIDPIWWTRGKVGRVVRDTDDWVGLAMLVPTFATTKRDVPLYASIGGKKVGSLAAGSPVIVVGTTRDERGRGWYFIERDGGYARARASSFLDKLPLP